MKTIDLLNLPYLVDALSEWLESGYNPRIEKILNHYNIDLLAINDLIRIKDLYAYHVGQLHTGYTPDYDTLRKGLKQYFDLYFSNFWRSLGLAGTSLELLDYGSGLGYYSDSFLKNNPEGAVFDVDKSNKNNPIDFEKNPDWYVRHQGNFDIVLLSEILHCKDADGRNYLVNSSRKLLKKGGLLIINENGDPFMDYRLPKLTSGGSALSQNDIIQLIHHEDFRLLSVDTIQFHKIYKYEKLQ